MRIQSITLTGTALLEVLFVSCFIGFAIVVMPGLFNSEKADLNASTAGMSHQILQMSLTSSGQELWVQKGLSEVVSVDVDTHRVEPVFAGNQGVGHWDVSSDGRTVLLASHDNEVLIYRNHELVFGETVANRTMLLTGLSSDGTVAVRIAGETAVRCWDLSTPEPTSN